jgi:hypothetical protein
LKLNIGNPAIFGFNAPDEIIHDIIINLQDAVPGKRSCMIANPRE